MKNSLLVAGILLLNSIDASATEPSDLCTGNPCRITKTALLGDGTIDFGADTEVRVQSGVTLHLGTPEQASVSIELVAGRFVLESGARIVALAKRRDIYPERMLTIRALDGSIVTERNSKIDFRGVDDSSSFVWLSATGDVVSLGAIRLAAKGEEAQAPYLLVQAGGRAQIDGRVSAPATGTYTLGGDVVVEADGDVSIGGRVDVRGNYGGTVELRSETGSVAIDGFVDASGRGANAIEAPGLAGEIEVEAPAGGILVGGILRARGSAGIDETGEGGSADLRAGTSILIDGRVELGGGAGGFGGSLDAQAGVDFVQGPASVIEANATPPGLYGMAGFVRILAGGKGVVRRLELSAPSGFGAVAVRADGEISVDGPVRAFGTGRESGGGYVELETAGEVRVSGLVDCSSRGRDGFAGGEVQVKAGSIDLRASSLVDSRSIAPPFIVGWNRLEAAGPMTIAGTLRGDRNSLFHRTTPPTITGTVDPAPEIIQIPGSASAAFLEPSSRSLLD